MEVRDLDFENVVREHQAGLRAFIRALGTDEAWVDDLAQEVFLIAYRKQEAFRAEADMGKWLRGIARRIVKGEQRKSAGRSRLLHQGLTDILSNLGHDEESNDNHASSLLPVMQACVKELPESARKLLAERYLEGRRAAELAEHLQMSSVAIRKKLQRIRQWVRDCVQQKQKEFPV